MSARTWRIASGCALFLLALLLLAAAFPWGMLKGRLESRLSERFGRPVTIGALERTDSLSLRPTLRIRDLRVPQAAWAGKGEVIRIAQAEVRVPLWTRRPDQIRIVGLHLDLVRAADGRESWQRATPRPRADGRQGRPRLSLLTVTDGHVRYRDAKRRRTLDASLSIDAKALKLVGNGTVLGSPITLDMLGPAVTGTSPWPFQVRIAGQALTMAIDGRMDRPLDVHHLDMTATARAANLAHVDTIIEAGLPRTQPVSLRAKARRDGADWRVSAMSGSVGRSDIAGKATIRKRDGRHIIEGDLRSRRFDFDDLSDAEGRAIAAAKRARFGPRVFPDTAIDLDNVARTDGTLRLHADRLLWPGPSPFRSLRGTLKIERSLLSIDDLRLGLTHGAMTGAVKVDQRKGHPILSVNLRLTGARLVDFVPDTQIDGRMEGRLRLTGPGRTIRSALGRSTGSIAVVARDGTLPARTASLLGQDLLKGLFTDKDKLATLRCAIVRVDARQGVASANPILIDTTRARTDMTGRVNLADESLTLSMSGTPKERSALRLQGAIKIKGTVKAPIVELPDKGGVVGTVLKSIGRALGGKPQPIAGDADCDALAARALR